MRAKNSTPDPKSLVLQRGSKSEVRNERPTTLLARAKTNSRDFDRVSECAQRMKDIWRAYPSWQRMTPAQKEGVEMIVHKLCRALCGDPNHKDHWLDIAGYATRVAEEIEV
jgi:hypothetical protein